MGEETDRTDVAGRLVPVQVVAAAVIVAVEALALVGIVVFLLVELIFATTDDVLRAISLSALCLGGAAVLGACARGLARLRPSSRAPVLVLQFLALPVGYSLAFQAHLVGYGGPILLAALATLYLLFTPPAREALDRAGPTDAT